MPLFCYLRSEPASGCSDRTNDPQHTSPISQNVNRSSSVINQTRGLRMRVCSRILQVLAFCLVHPEIRAAKIFAGETADLLHNVTRDVLAMPVASDVLLCTALLDSSSSEQLNASSGGRRLHQDSERQRAASGMLAYSCSFTPIHTGVDTRSECCLIDIRSDCCVLSRHRQGYMKITHGDHGF